MAESSSSISEEVHPSCIANISEIKRDGLLDVCAVSGDKLHPTVADVT